MKYLLFAALIGLLSGCATFSPSAPGYRALHPVSGNSPDFVRARALFKAAAAEGDATSRSLYAAMGMAGLGGPVDMATAMQNLQAADQQGSTRAALLLADVYARGAPAIGVQRDLGLALDYANRAERRRGGKSSGAQVAAWIQRLQRHEPAEAVIHLTPTRSAGTDGPPQCIAQVVPNYPVPLQVLGLHARVIVDFYVGPDGRPTHIQVVRPTLPPFDAAAVAAVAGFKFLPGVKGGVPVRTHLQVPIDFALGSR